MPACKQSQGGGGGAGGATTSSSSSSSSSGTGGATSSSSGSGGGSGGATTSSSSGTGGAASTSSSSSSSSGGTPGAVLWSKAIPITNAASYAGIGAVAMATDGADDVAIGGLITGGTVDFGGGPRTTPGAPHDELSYIVEFDSAGGYRWDRSTIIGGAEAPYVDHLAMNASGQVVATVSYSMVGVPDHSQIVSAYGASGVLAWSKTYFASTVGPDISASALGIDAAGDVYLLDNILGGTVDFGGGPLDHPVVELSATGQHVWSKNVPAVFTTFDASGHTYLNGTIAGCGPSNASLAKLDPQGNCMWAKSFAGAPPAFSIAASSAGDIYLAGVLLQGQAVDLGCGTLANTAISSLLVAKLDSTGTCVWSKLFSSPTFDMTTYKTAKITTDGLGDVYVTGVFKGTIDFGGGPISDTSLTQPFLVKLTPSGALAWSTQASGSFAWAGGANGALYLASGGSFSLGGSPPLTTNGMLLMKLAP